MPGLSDRVRMKLLDEAPSLLPEPANADYLRIFLPRRSDDDAAFIITFYARGVDQKRNALLIGSWLLRSFRRKSRR